MRKLLLGIVVCILISSTSASAETALVEKIQYDGAREKMEEGWIRKDNQILTGGNGIYLGVDVMTATIPENKRWIGFTNSPIYVYDSNYNFLKQINYNNFRYITKFYDGYFYLWEKTYGETDTIEKYYKTIDGETLIEISKEQYQDVIETKVLYNQKKYKMEDSEVERDGLVYVYENEAESLQYNDKFCRIGRESDQMIYHRALIPATDFYVPVIFLKNDLYSLDAGVYAQISPDGVSRITVPDDANSDEMWNDETYLYIGSKAEPDCCYRIRLSDIDGYIKVICNGEYLSFEEPPAVEEDYTLVPMRFLFEKMGAEVDWDEDSRTATVRQADRSVAFSIDNLEARVNSAPVEMQIPARLINGKTMVPLRFLSENLGYTVDWDAGTKTAVITTN